MYLGFALGRHFRNVYGEVLGLVQRIEATAAGRAQLRVSQALRARGSCASRLARADAECRRSCNSPGDSQGRITPEWYTRSDIRPDNDNDADVGPDSPEDIRSDC